MRPPCSTTNWSAGLDGILDEGNRRREPRHDDAGADRRLGIDARDEHRCERDDSSMVASHEVDLNPPWTGRSL